VSDFPGPVRHLGMAGYEAVHSTETLELAERQHRYPNSSILYPPQLASDRLEALAMSSDISSDGEFDEDGGDIEKHSFLSAGNSGLLGPGDDTGSTQARSKVQTTSPARLHFFLSADGSGM
jgi:hypothetical protein